MRLRSLSVVVGLMSSFTSGSSSASWRGHRFESGCEVGFSAAPPLSEPAAAPSSGAVVGRAAAPRPKAPKPPVPATRSAACKSKSTHGRYRRLLMIAGGTARGASSLEPEPWGACRAKVQGPAVWGSERRVRESQDLPPGRCRGPPRQGRAPRPSSAVHYLRSEQAGPKDPNLNRFDGAGNAARRGSRAGAASGAAHDQTRGQGGRCRSGRAQDRRARPWDGHATARRRRERRERR